MTFLLTLVITTIVVIVCRKLIARYAGVFYALAIALDLGYLLYRFVLPYNPAVFAALELMQRGVIAVSLFTVVMFIGALGPSNRFRIWLNPIRAELSLMACLLVLGHALGYLTSYLTTIFLGSGVLPTVVLLSLITSLVLLILLLILGITTLPLIRKRMNPDVWKKVQRMSYIFFGLIYAHLTLMILPGAISGIPDSMISMVAYTAVFISYLIARLIKTKSDKTVYLEEHYQQSR
jgi:DMSO/TMAO reductase YedYZ heme-binding membrane subunit